MLDTVRRFWQEHAPQPRPPREEPERPVARSGSPAAPPYAARADFALTSIDVGNYT